MPIRPPSHSATTVTDSDFTVDGGYVRIIVDDASNNGPEVHYTGYNGGWVSGIDVANSPTSRDFVVAAKKLTYKINDAATTSGSAVVTSLNAIVGAGGGVTQVKADTDAATALSGGTNTGLILAWPANERVTVDLPPLVLTPGVTLGVSIPISATSSRSIMAVYFFEESE